MSMKRSVWVLIGDKYYTKDKNNRGKHLVATHKPFEGYKLIGTVDKIPETDGNKA